MSKIFTVIFLLVSALNLYSQEYTIRGRVLDAKNKEPLIGANILVVRQNDLKKTGGYSDKNGFFEIKGLQSSRYIMKISFVGYKPNEKNIQIRNSDLYLNDLILQTDSIIMKEITSFGNLPIAEQKDDTIQFIASSYKVNKDANTDELVQKMPGITIESGTVKAQGENVKQVLVDGRQFFGEDPMASLKNLPAEIVEKVQVYDKQSEQAQFTGFDDGNTSKTMNIITKSRMRNGKFGKLGAGYGYETKYQSSGVLNLFDNMQRISIVAQSNNINNQNFSIEDILGAMGGGGGGGFRGMGGRMGGGGMRTMRQGSMGGREMGGGIGGRGGELSNFMVSQADGISTVHALGFNYSNYWDDKTQLTGSYFFNLNNNDAEKDLNRAYLESSNPDQKYYEKSSSESKNINHRMNVKFEYSIDTTSRLLIQPRLTFQSNDGNSYSDARTFLSNLLSNSSLNDFSSYMKAYNFSNEIVYNKRFSSSGRSISIGLNTTYNNNTGESNSNADNVYYSQSIVYDSLVQDADLEKNGYRISTNVLFTQPIIENNFLQVSYSLAYNKNESDKKSFDITEPVAVLDTSLTNIFSNKYWTHRTGLSYGYQTKDLRLSLGVFYNFSKYDDVQDFPSNYTMKRSYNDVLPSAHLRYNINARQNMMFSYMMQANIPSVDQLQNVLDNSNQLQLSIGNPELEEEVNHSLNLRYSSVGSDLTSSFFIMLNSRISGAYIGKNTIFANSDTTVLNNIPLYSGTQITYPVNLKNYFNINCFSSYGTSIAILQSSINFNSNLSYSKTPNSINDVQYYSFIRAAGLGITISSNMSEDFDFTLSTNYSYNDVSSANSSKTNYYNYYTRLRLNYIFLDDFVFQTNANYQYFNNISGSDNQKNLQVNLSIGKKFLSNNQAEIKFSVYDIFNTGSAIQKNSTEYYVEDVTTNVLKRYYLLGLTYNFRSFGSGS